VVQACAEYCFHHCHVLPAVLLPPLLRLLLAMLLQVLLWAGVAVKGMCWQVHYLHCYLLPPPRSQMNCAKGSCADDIIQVQLVTVGAAAGTPGKADPATREYSTGTARLSAAARRAN
jgi:hypothetical protein